MSSTEWNGTHPVRGPAADAQVDRDTKQMVDAIVASMTSRAEAAEAERDRLARVVSVMRGESEHLPKGWAVERLRGVLGWRKGPMSVAMHVDCVGGMVSTPTLWGTTGMLIWGGPDPLTMMEDADQRYPPAP